MDEHRLRVLGNRILRKMSGLKRVGVTGDWRRLRNEDLYYLHSSPNVIRMIIQE
jgi:hypothetical protein